MLSYREENRVHSMIMGGREVRMEYLDLLLQLLPHVIIVVIGFGLLHFARRQPRASAVLVAAVVALGLAAVWHAADVGYGYRPALGRVVFGSATAHLCFSVGSTLLVLAVPACWLLLVAVVRPEKKGHDGWFVGQYWFVCVVFAMVLFSWLTGYVK